MSSTHGESNGAFHVYIYLRCFAIKCFKTKLMPDIYCCELYMC
jgi:hypothetical protein